MSSVLDTLGDVWAEMERVQGSAKYLVEGVDGFVAAFAPTDSEGIEVATSAWPALLTPDQARALAARLLVLAMRAEGAEE